MRRSSAYKSSRSSKKLVKKIKSFLVYSSLAVFLVLFLSQIFLSNILEYSFSLAKSGVGKDFKNADKYNLLLVNKNSLGEVLGVDLVVFDKLNLRLYTFEIDTLQENFTYQKKVGSIKSLFNGNFNQNDFVSSFEKNYGLMINHSMVFGGEEFDLYKKTVQGETKLNEIIGVFGIKDVGIRNTFLMYSFSKDLGVEDKKTLKINSIFNLDKELKSIYLDSEIANEKLSISIVNSTGINGLGKRISRFVTNFGGRVIDVNSRNEEIKESFILYKEESKSLDYLSNILGIKNKKKISEFSTGSAVEHPEIIKSDIVVVLGLDIPEDLK